MWVNLHVFYFQCGHSFLKIEKDSNIMVRSKNTYIFLKSEQCSDLGGWVGGLRKLGCLDFTVQMKTRTLGGGSLIE